MSLPLFLCTVQSRPSTTPDASLLTSTSSPAPPPAADEAAAAEASTSGQEDLPDPAAVATVLVFAAQYYSGLPYQGPLVMLLKEYLPGSRAAGLREVEVHRKLQGGLPENKWQVWRGANCFKNIRVYVAKLFSA